MSESGKKYIEIPEYEPTDLGVDFDALLKELNELRERQVTDREKITCGEGSSWREEFFDHAILTELSDRLVEYIEHLRPDMESEDERKEMVIKKAGEILENVSARIIAEVDPEHEVRLFGQVAELIDGIWTKSDIGGENAKTAGAYNGVNKTIGLREDVFQDTYRPIRLLSGLIYSGEADRLATVKHELIHKDQNRERDLYKDKIKPPKKTMRERFFSNDAFKGLTIGVGLAELSPFFLDKLKSLPKEYQTVLVLFYIGYAIPFVVSKIYSGLDNRQKGEQRDEKNHQKHILDESQAYIAADRVREFKDLHSHFDREQLESGGGGYSNNITKKEDWDKLIMAYQQIKELYALGLSDTEVSSLVGKATWNQEELAYDELSARIKAEADKHGWDDEDVQNLVLAEDLREKIKLLKASIIAWEEFEKATNF